MQQFLAAMSGGAGAGAMNQITSPGLSSILKTDALLKLIDEHPEVKAELMQQLPEGQQHSEEALR
jgi:hypothetical protein